jgi:tetratricopeptide (TPR) repeat protein
MEGNKRMSKDVEVVDSESVNIGDRIKEILEEKKEEKGNAFSIRAFSQRIGMTKNVLGDSIKGIRPIRPSEVEKVAQGFGITVPRLKREDTKQLEDEMLKLVKGRTNLKRALEIGNYLMPLAIGCTERCLILNTVGVIYYLTKQYENALNIWNEALTQAQKIKELYNDSSQVYKVTRNLIRTYTELKDLVGLTKLLDSLEPQFADMDELSAGTLIHSKAMTAYNLGNLKSCHAHMYKLLNIYENLQPLYRGFAYQNVAYIEYVLGNYPTAKDYFEKAITEKSGESLRGFVESRLLSVKDYCKCLLKLNEKDAAVRLLEASLQELQTCELPEMTAQFLLLRAVAKNDPKSADSVLALDVANQLKALACDFLMKHYSNLDDSDSLMKYYRIAMNFKSMQINWEGI